MPIPPEPLTNPRKGAAGPAASSRSVPLGKAKGHTVTRGRSPGHAPPVLQLGPLSFWKLPHTHFPGLSGRKGAVCPLNLGVRFCFYAKIPVDSLCITGLAVAPTLHNPSCLLRSEGLRVLRASVAASWRGPRAPCEAPASCAQPSRPASVLPRATRPASPGPLSRLLLAQGFGHLYSGCHSQAPTQDSVWWTCPSQLTPMCSSSGASRAPALSTRKSRRRPPISDVNQETTYRHPCSGVFGLLTAGVPPETSILSSRHKKTPTAQQRAPSGLEGKITAFKSSSRWIFKLDSRHQLPVVETERVASACLSAHQPFAGRQART